MKNIFKNSIALLLILLFTGGLTYGATILFPYQGGTGIGSYTAGDLLYASGTGTLSKLGIGGDNEVLKINGTTIGWESDGVGGDVVGSASSTDHAVVRFDGTTGKLIQDSSIIITDAGYMGIATTTPAYELEVDGTIQANTALRSDYWISSTGNSMNVQPTGDVDDFFSFKTPADRPTIKREGGKYIYIDSSNVYDMGISLREDATYSATFGYEKDTHRMALSGKGIPLVIKLNSDYDDYFLLQTIDNIPEMTVASSTAMKINAGGTNSLFLNHSGGNVGIGATTTNQLLTLDNSMSFKEIASANADTAGYGQLWVKTATPNELWFTDDAGTDAQLGVVGAGDVTGVGDCALGACFDGSSDGGTYLRFYDGDSDYTSLVSSNVATTTAIVLPATSGTLVHSGVTTLSSLTSIGTIGTGTWAATDVGVEYGGSGASTLTGILLGNGVSAFTATTTSLGLIDTISDETGTGALVFGTSPTFTTGITVPNDSISHTELSEGDAFVFTGSVAIPQGSPTIDGAGEIGIDTTSDQLVYYGGAKRVLSHEQTMGFALEDPVDADDNVPFHFPKRAITITDVYCQVDGGTSIAMVISDGTNALESITCDADGAEDDGSIANGSFTARERMEFDLDAASGTNTWLNIVITYTIDAD